MLTRGVYFISIVLGIRRFFIRSKIVITAHTSMYQNLSPYTIFNRTPAGALLDCLRRPPMSSYRAPPSLFPRRAVCLCRYRYDQIFRFDL